MSRILRPGSPFCRAGVLVSTLLAAALPAHAELFVGTAVTDAGAALGSAANPYLTFNAAAQAASLAGGGSVTVLSGDYAAQQITYGGTASNAVVFNAQSGVRILNDGSNGWTVSQRALSIVSDYVSVNGLQVVGNAGSVTYDQAVANILVKDGSVFNTIGIVAQGQHVTVNNCIVRDTTGVGMSATGLSNKAVDYINFTNNVVARCGWYNPGGSGGGISVQGTTSLNDGNTGVKISIANNLVYGCANRVISSAKPDYVSLTIDEGQGIQLTRNDAYTTGVIEVRNNLVMYSGSKGIAAMQSDRAVIDNNTTYLDGLTMTNNPTGINLNASEGVTVSDNLIYSFSKSAVITNQLVDTTQPASVFSNNVAIGPVASSTAFKNFTAAELRRLTLALPDAGDLRTTAPELAGIGADNTVIATQQAKLATILTQGAPVPVDWHLSTAQLYGQQVFFMLNNGAVTTANPSGTVWRLDRNDPNVARQYAPNLAGTTPTEVLGTTPLDPVSTATLAFNNRTPVFTQWADAALAITNHSENGFRVTTNETLQTYFVNSAWLANAGGDGSGYLMLQRGATTLTLAADTAGTPFRLDAVDLAAGEGLTGRVRVRGWRSGALIATADLDYAATEQTFSFSSLGAGWENLDTVTFERTAGLRTYFDNITVTAIPEPTATAAVLGLGALALIRRRHRRRV